MSKIALIRNGVVEDIIVGDIGYAASIPGVSAVDVSLVVPQPAVGWRYSGGSFSIPAPVSSGKSFTHLQFRRLFSQAERVAFDNYDTIGSWTAQQKATLKTITTDFDAAEEIRTDDPDTITAVNYLESIGLIQAGRAAQILSA